jgi:NTE family protein
MNEIKTGLVLSGGGAKGAYQVGAIKALVEYGFEFDMISGASIGALNGAVLASSGSFSEGAAKLEFLWKEICKLNVLQPNLNTDISLIRILSNLGLNIGPIKYLSKINRIYDSAKNKGLIDVLNTDVLKITDSLIKIAFADEDALLSNDPIKKIVSDAVDIKKLKDGIPLFVSVYESEGRAIKDFMTWLLSEKTGLFETKDSEFIRVNGLSEDLATDVILASAALPILFSSKKIDGKNYRDGGLGGTNKVQGNTPITPLIDNGCNFVVVTHLSDGSLWSRHDFPDTTVLEIRPQSFIKRDGATSDMLSFNPEKIIPWIEQGYEDAKICIKNVAEPLIARKKLKFTEQLMIESMKQSEESGKLLDEKIQKLGKKFVQKIEPTPIKGNIAKSEEK